MHATNTVTSVASKEFPNCDTKDPGECKKKSTVLAGFTKWMDFNRAIVYTQNIKEQCTECGIVDFEKAFDSNHKKSFCSI